MKLTLHRFSTVVELDDGRHTTVHVVRYYRDAFKPRIVLLEQAACLVDWCAERGVAEAIVGGFFLRSSSKVLGDTWVNGFKQDSVPVTTPWDKVRGSVHITTDGELSLGRRELFPAKPENDLLQAGPMLVSGGKAQIILGKETEGVSDAFHQFDTDITVGRYPRAAIGLNKQFIWSVVCDGRSKQDAGLTLEELANVMLMLGAQDALNLDGGGSASQVSGGRLRNNARGDGKEYLKGRPIYSAIVFE